MMYLYCMPPPSNIEDFWFFRELVEQTNQVVFAYRIDTAQFVYLNPAFEAIWQQKRESITADPASLLKTVHPEDRPYLTKTVKAILSGTQHKKEVEFRIQLPNQTERWISVTAFLLGSNTTEPTLAGFAHEITVQKKYNNTLKKFAAKKNSVLEILSHDLAGPLGTIQGLSGVLSKRIKKYDDQELNDLIELITETSKRSIQLIREFVKQEFLESAEEGLVKKRVDLVQKIKESVEQYKQSERDIIKTFRLSASNEAVYIAIDDVKFMQVINNLVSNAIKFTHDGGVISINVEDQDKHVLVTVADDGIGIPTRLQADLFEKFTKARRAGIKGEPSVGLGMSIIRTIVEWHNGKIWFESQENQGTTFYIQIPKE